MARNSRRRFLTGLLSVLPLLFFQPRSAGAAEDVFRGVERVVAVGDVHGDYEHLVAVLRFAGLIDGENNWSGGKTHLVQTGDLVDRGPRSRDVVELMMKLESQARKAGGYVHALIGNHDAMNVYGDLRYVTPQDFASYLEGDSSKARKPNDGQHPPGYEEHRRMWNPDGKYGRWVRGHNAVIQIDGTVFVHGGIGPKYAGYSIREINSRVREELSDFALLKGGMVADAEGPLWYRGLASGDEQELAGHVEAVLKKWKAERIVIGHTFADGAITPRWGGKVLMIDIGLARLYDTFIRQACLVIERGKPYALHRGKRLELPADSGRDMLRYLKEAAALDPQPSSLEPRIAKLEAALGGAGAR